MGFLKKTLLAVGILGVIFSLGLPLSTAEADELKTVATSEIAKDTGELTIQEKRAKFQADYEKFLSHGKYSRAGGLGYSYSAVGKTRAGSRPRKRTKIVRVKKSNRSSRASFGGNFGKINNTRLRGSSRGSFRR